MSNQTFVTINGLPHLVFDKIGDVPVGYNGHTKILDENILVFFQNGHEKLRSIIRTDMSDVPVNYTGVAYIESELARCVFKNGKLHSEHDCVSYSVITDDYVINMFHKHGVKHNTRTLAVLYADRTSDKNLVNQKSEYWVDGILYSEKEWKEKHYKPTASELFHTLEPSFKNQNDVPKDFTGICRIASGVLVLGNTHNSYVNGKLHNLSDGAVKLFNGNKEYYINDIRYSKEEWQHHPEVINHKIKSILGE